MRNAWHYTTGEAWEQIRKEGLIPQPIGKPEVTQWTGLLDGIWLWPKEQDELAHCALLVERAMRSPALSAVVLLVEYEWHRILRDVLGGSSLELTHSGRGDGRRDWKYHEDEPCFIYLDPIPPGDIEMMGSYDLHDLLAKEWSPLNALA